MFRKKKYPRLTQFPKQDEHEAFILLNLAFDMVGLDFKVTQNKELLNIVTNMGLGFSDTFYGDVVNKELQAEDVLLMHQQGYMEAMKKYAFWYLTEKERANLSDFDYMSRHWKSHHSR